MNQNQWTVNSGQKKVRPKPHLFLSFALTLFTVYCPLSTAEADRKTDWEKRGHAIESNFNSQAFSRFDVQFYGSENRNMAWDAVKYLNEMYMDVGALFGEHPQRRIPVIVFTTGEFLAAWRAPFIGGFFDRRDGKIRIRVDEMSKGDEEFRHRARHEMTHAFLFQLCPKELPSWASEGIAEFCARNGVSQGFWKDNRLEEIRKTRKGMPWLSLEQINSSISKKSGSMQSLYLSYLESEALVLWIAKDKGDSWVPRVVKYFAQNDVTFDGAYKALYGVTLESEMERLRRYWE